MISCVCLLICLTVAVGCQSGEVENLGNNSGNNTPGNALLQNETIVEQESPTRPSPALTPTVSRTPEIMATNTPEVTHVSTGEVYIISDPEGALAFIGNNNLREKTPLSWALPSGTYLVTLTMAGYEDWTTSITVEVGSRTTLTATLRQQHTVTPVDELNGPLWHAQWSDNGQSLTYAVNGGFLPVYQEWWHYDVANGEKQSLPSPQTRVTNVVRELLGVCPFPLPENRPYPCSPILWESPISERIVIQSEKLGSNVYTWLANIDGSDVIPIEVLDAPQDVIWSSDGQWLLIGNYWGTDNSSLYYLVSSDGAFVANLEQLTSTSHFRVQGPKPAFSPDGQKLAFVGIETGGEPWNGKPWSAEELDQEEDYNLYVLDLNTLEYELVSSRFGVFQWALDGNGLYVLDGSANTVLGYVKYRELSEGIRYAELYYIDLTRETYPEQKLAEDIPIEIPYLGAWAYSPEVLAMAGVFNLKGCGLVFGILWLK